MNLEEISQTLTSVTVKGTWLKFVEEDMVMEDILPLRLPMEQLKQLYPNATILDTRQVQQHIEIPYSSLLLDGDVETVYLKTKYTT